MNYNIIKEQLKSTYWNDRRWALLDCIGEPDVPLDIIQTGLNDSSETVNFVALELCVDRKDIPQEMIEPFLFHQDDIISYTAIRLYKKNDWEIPFYRSIEPPELVYKKCQNNIIVAAHIPDDAQVRGSLDGKCRADKAIIVDVIGSDVGISQYDGKTKYYKGDTVTIKDFDLSTMICSTGFHFFCNKKLAIDYNLAYYKI